MEYRKKLLFSLFPYALKSDTMNFVKLRGVIGYLQREHFIGAIGAMWPKKALEPSIPFQ